MRTNSISRESEVTDDTNLDLIDDGDVGSSLSPSPSPSMEHHEEESYRQTLPDSAPKPQRSTPRRQHGIKPNSSKTPTQNTTNIKTSIYSPRSGVPPSPSPDSYSGGEDIGLTRDLMADSQQESERG